VARSAGGGITTFTTAFSPALRLAISRCEILRAADEHALHEHHGKGGPAGPHLEDEAAAPLAEISLPYSRYLCARPAAASAFLAFFGNGFMRMPTTTMSFAATAAWTSFRTSVR